MAKQFYDPTPLLNEQQDGGMTLRRLSEVTQRDPHTLRKVLSGADGKLSLLFETAAALDCTVEITIRAKSAA